MSATLDKLYEETTFYYQQRAEFRLKLNLLHERLQKTKTQGQRELREYRRLLNNDEKLSHFLAQKNKIRGNFGDNQSLQNVAQNVCEEQMTQKDIQEWIQFFTEQYGHAQFETIVNQYLHNLEHGYVLYGLIAQKNNEIDQLEDTISHLEHQFKGNACNLQPRNSPTLTPSDQFMRQVVVIFQSILNAVDLQFHLPQDQTPLLVQCQQACDLLWARVNSMLAFVASKSTKTEKLEQSLEMTVQKSVDSEDSLSLEIPSTDV